MVLTSPGLGLEAHCFKGLLYAPSLIALGSISEGGKLCREMSSFKFQNLDLGLTTQNHTLSLHPAGCLHP